MKVRIQNALFSEHRIITWLPLLLLLLLAGPAELDAQSFGVYSVNYSTQDLLYDPVRDRLLLSVMNDASLGQSNGLAVFNPYTGLTESFISMTAAPGRMARADDGHFLYVSKPDAGTVQQFNLPTLTTSYSFPIGGEQIYGIQYTNYAANLAVVPGQPNAVVAWTVRHVNAGAMEYGEGIALYENGVMASNVAPAVGVIMFSGSWEVLFDTNSGTLFGYNNGDLRHCTFDSNGVSFAEQYPMLYYGGADIKYGGGHLFNTGGEMIDYDPFQIKWLFAGAQNAAAVAPDAASGRVFYLVHNSNWQINAYDVSTRRFLGSLTVSNVVGTSTQLIRWGTDGLAFQTTGKQLFILRSPMVRTDTFADVAVTLDAPPGPVSPGNGAEFTVTLTNQGTVPATNVVVTNTLSPVATLSAISSSAGTWTTNSNGGAVVWSLSSLAAGAQATLSYTASAAQTGLVTAVSTATTPDFDPVLQNNTAVATLLVGAPLGLDDPVSIQLPANDIVWSPSLAKILVTANAGIPNWGGTVLSVDPASLAVRCEVPLGTDAGSLAISRDGAVLYAATDANASEVAIPPLTITNRFLVNPASPGAYAADMKVAPGNDQVVAIGSRSRSDYSAWIAAFNNGVQLTNVDSFYSPVLSLEFGDQPSPLYAYTGSAFTRYTFDSSGVTTLDANANLVPYRTALDMVWGNGLIYSSLGTVIDPANLTLRGTIGGIPSGSGVVYDSGSGWVFYFCPGGNQVVLKAFDGTTLLPAGSRTIPNVGGTISRFIRWGTDGFAAITSNGQMLLFRSSLVPTNPPADVSVSLTHNPPPFIQGSNITATITISNAGPNGATSISWNYTLPGGAIVGSVNASAGTVTTNATSIAGSIPLLPVNAAATVTVTLTVPASGIATDQILVTASSTDPNFADNSAFGALWIQTANGSSNLVLLSLQVKDLESDPTRPVLYASLGGTAGSLANTVVTIDPDNESIGTMVPAGSEPGRLAVSADGHFLYVALDGAGTVQKLSLPGLATVGSFVIPPGQIVVRMKVCPTNSDMVAIRCSPSGETSLFVAGVQRPNQLNSQDLFAFLNNGQLFGCDGFHSDVKLYRLDTGPDGVSLLAGQPGKQDVATDLQSSSNLLFFNGGMVVNPITTRVLDLMPVPYNSVVAPDVACGRVFYLTPGNGTWGLHAFDISQGIEVGSVALLPLAGPPQKLLRWGDDGLAFYNSNSQIVILRGQLVPTNPPVDVVLSQSIDGSTAFTNSAIGFSLLVTNLGPVDASGVVVTQSFSMALTNVSLATSMGAATYSNGITSWQIGNLSTGTVATLSVTGAVTQTGTLTATAFAHHDLNDPFWGNNVAMSAVQIPGADTNNTIMIRFPVRQLLYDAERDIIYASTAASNGLAGNLIVKIDPITGTIQSALPAGSEPDRICLSDDDSYLNVALDGAMGIQRFNLDSNIADLSFGFSTNDIVDAQDLLAQPGHPQTIAASLAPYSLSPGPPTTVLAYDHGLQRQNPGSPAAGLTFSSDGSTVFGYVPLGFGTGVERMSLGPEGFQTTPVGGFKSSPGNLQFSNGRLYSQSGQVVDPNAGVPLGTIAASGPSTIDSANGRAYYLVQTGGIWQIRAFDLATLQSAGTQTVSNVQGTPGSLIRCGQDRLAFPTTAGQVFIVHSPLVATNPMVPANLSVSQMAAEEFLPSTEAVQFHVIVTNSGPGPATNVLLAINPPSPVTSLNLQPPQGTFTNSGSNYLCNLGSLAAGRSLDIVLTAVITNTAYYSNFVSVSAATLDPDLSDNTSSATVQGLFLQPANTTVIHSLPSTAGALAYDFIHQRLFASMSGGTGTNLLAWYDPQSAVMGGSMRVGLMADKMQVTDDGQYLYLCASSTGLVQRIALSSLNLDLSFTPPQATSIAALTTLPGRPHSIALSYWTNGIPVTAVFDDEIARTNALTDHPFTILAASTDGTNLYGYANTGTGGNSPRIFRMAITDPGLQELDSGPSEVPWVYTSTMKYALNALFFGTGDVLDPSSWSSESSFVLPGYSQGGFDLIPQFDRAAFLAGDLNIYNLAHVGIYSISNRQELGQFDIRTPSGGFSSLTWCGADRLAFLTSGEIVFVRSSSIPSADISIVSSFTTNQILAGDTANLQIVVSNAGPFAVTNVVVTNTLPNNFVVRSATVSQGDMVTNGETLVVNLGGMKTNSSAILNLGISLNSVLVDSITNRTFVTDETQVFTADLPDPVPFNNSAISQMVVTPRDSDHDGIPDYWDVRYGFDPNDPAVASEDSAGDGISNLQKYLSGLDPFTFYGMSITAWKIDKPSNFYFTVHGAVGMTYTLESSSNLVQWSPVFMFLCQSTNQSVQVPFDPAIPAAFYRISTTTNPPISILSIINPTEITTNAPILRVAAPAGHSYTVYVSTDLLNWTVLTNIYSTIWNTHIICPSSNAGTTRFYRAATQ